MKKIKKGVTWCENRSYHLSPGILLLPLSSPPSTRFIFIWSAQTELKVQIHKTHTGFTGYDWVKFINSIGYLKWFLILNFGINFHIWDHNITSTWNASYLPRCGKILFMCLQIFLSHFKFQGDIEFVIIINFWFTKSQES